MGKGSDEKVKKILQQYLYEPPHISTLERNQLNRGGEILKSISRNGYRIEFRITFQGWQITVSKGGTICGRSSRPWRL